MTKAARISQADVDRALKGLRNAGIEKARVTLDLVNHRIDIIIGETGPIPSISNPWDEEWSSDDV